MYSAMDRRNLIVLATVVTLLAAVSTFYFVASTHTKSNLILNQIDSTSATYTDKTVTEYSAGKRIFISHCNDCHFRPDKIVDDNIAFGGLSERLPQPFDSSIKKFLCDEKALKDAGIQYYLDLASSHRSTFNHSYKDSLTETELNNLILYLKITQTPSR